MDDFTTAHPHDRPIITPRNYNQHDIAYDYAVQTAQGTILENLRRFHTTDRGTFLTDITLTTSAGTLTHAHRSILAASSRYFYNRFALEPKETSFTIPLTPLALHHALSYLYSGSYDPSPSLFTPLPLSAQALQSGNSVNSNASISASMPVTSTTPPRYSAVHTIASHAEATLAGLTLEIPALVTLAESHVKRYLDKSPYSFQRDQVLRGLFRERSPKLPEGGVWGDVRARARRCEEVEREYYGWKGKTA